MRFPLQQVTAVAVDTETPVLAAEALVRTMAMVDFGRAVLFTTGWLPPRIIPGLDVIEVDPLPTAGARDAFLRQHLPFHVRSSHALVLGWDGFPTQPAAWGHEFLTFDFVAAPVDAAPPPWANRLSLRSRRLLAAGLDARVLEPGSQAGTTLPAWLNATHGVTVAPDDIAVRFARVDPGAPRRPAFGFQGAQALPWVLDDATLARWLGHLPEAFFRSPDCRALGRGIHQRRMVDAASRLLDRCRAAGVPDTAPGLLGAASSLMGLLSPRWR